MASLGATVTRVDGNYDESVRAAQQAADDNGWFVVYDTSYEGYTQVPSQVMAGYGVMAEEIVEQVGEELLHAFSSSSQTLPTACIKAPATVS